MTPYTISDAEAEARAAIDSGDVERITAAGRTLDALDPRATPVPLLSAALWYAEQGLHVFPLQPGRKDPWRGSHGFMDATTDATQINAWWDKEPLANVGIATGHLVDVIDVDGPVGVRSWIDLHDDLPPVIGKVSTPRPGGNHLYVAAEPGRGNKAGIFPGIDYRGTGGYVVAPPSRITVLDERHKHLGDYRWYRPLDIAALAQDGVA